MALFALNIDQYMDSFVDQDKKPDKKIRMNFESIRYNKEIYFYSRQNNKGKQLPNTFEQQKHLW